MEMIAYYDTHYIILVKWKHV